MHDFSIPLQGLVSGAIWFRRLLAFGTVLLGVGSSAAQPSDWLFGDEGVVAAAGSANWEEVGEWFSPEKMDTTSAGVV